MSDTVLVALIGGGFTLIGTILTVIIAVNKSSSEMRTSLAVMKNDMEELTREVRGHNNFAQRMPVLEEKIDALDRRLTKVENNEN